MKKENLNDSLKALNKSNPELVRSWLRTLVCGVESSNIGLNETVILHPSVCVERAIRLLNLVSYGMPDLEYPEPCFTVRQKALTELVELIAAVESGNVGPDCFLTVEEVVERAKDLQGHLNQALS